MTLTSVGGLLTFLKIKNPTTLTPKTLTPTPFGKMGTTKHQTITTGNPPMKLEAIQLQDFKKHEDLTVNFSNTLTVIRGPNWAGKSSILHGIVFALFGSKAVPCAKERIPRRGLKNCKVTLWFSHNDIEYVIERTLTTCQLFADGVLKATSASAVTDMVEAEILGLTFKDAMTLAYSPQSQTASLLTLGVPALNRMIESLTQADIIETLITRGAKIAQRAHDGLAAVGESLDNFEAETEIANWKVALGMAQAEFKRVTDAANEIKGQLLRLESSQTEKMSRNEKIMFALADRRQLEAVMTTLEEIETKLANLKTDRLIDLDLKLTELNAAYIGLYNRQNEVRNAEASIIKLDQWFDTTGKDWEEKEANIPLLEAEKAKLEELTGDFQTASFAYENAQKAYATKSAELEHGVCQACDRPFDNFNPEEAKKALDEAIENATWAKSALDGKRKLVTASKAEIARLERLQPPAGYEDTHAGKVAEYENLQKFVGDFSTPTLHLELADARKAVETQQALVATAQAEVREANGLKLKRESGRMQKSGLEKALADAPTGEPEDLAPLTAEIARVRESYYSASSLCSDAQQTVSSAQSEIRAWEAALKMAVERNEKRASLEKRAERFDAVVTWLRKSKNAFLGKIWDQITLISSETVANATMGYASSLSRTDDGEFMVIEDGEEVPMISASGGMASICGVALRMALDSVLSQSVGFVVLDEPSSELNDEHAASLAGALRASQRQVILVTHRSGEEFVSDSVLTL